MAIVGLLVGVLVSVFGGVRTSAQDAACRANLRQLGTAVLTYSAETGFFPPSISGGLEPHLGGAPRSEIWAYYLRPYMGAESKDYSAAGHSPLVVCPAAAITVDGHQISSYSANPGLMPDITGPNGGEAVRVMSVIRPSEVILFGDAIQRNPQGAHSNFWLVPEMTGSDSSLWADPTMGSTPIGVGSDMDGVNEAQFRYRHRGSANVVFADGRTESFEKGSILVRNVRKNY